MTTINGLNFKWENGKLVLDGDHSKNIEKYFETEMAQPTNRILFGSSDHGYAAEYYGYGTIDDVDVIAVYLFDESEIFWEDGTPKEEEDYPWDSALVRFLLSIK